MKEIPWEYLCTVMFSVRKVIHELTSSGPRCIEPIANFSSLFLAAKYEARNKLETSSSKRNYDDTT